MKPHIFFEDGHWYCCVGRDYDRDAGDWGRGNTAENAFLAYEYSRDANDAEALKEKFAQSAVGMLLFSETTTVQ